MRWIKLLLVGFIGLFIFKTVYCYNLYIVKLDFESRYVFFNGNSYSSIKNMVISLNLTKAFGITNPQNVTVCESLPCNKSNSIPFCYYQPDGSCTNTTPSNVIYIKLPGTTSYNVIYNLFIKIGNDQLNNAYDPTYVFYKVIKNYNLGANSITLTTSILTNPYYALGSINCPLSSTLGVCYFDFGYSAVEDYYTLRYYSTGTDFGRWDTVNGVWEVGNPIISLSAYSSTTPTKLYFNVGSSVYTLAGTPYYEISIGYNHNNIIVINHQDTSYYDIEDPHSNLKIYGFNLAFLALYNLTLPYYTGYPKYYKYYLNYYTNLKPTYYAYTNILNISFTPETRYQQLGTTYTYHFAENHTVKLYLDGKLLNTTNITDGSIYHYTIKLDDTNNIHYVTIYYKGLITGLWKNVTFEIVPKYYNVILNNQSCYTSPCNISVTYRCGVFNLTGGKLIPYSTKIESTYNITPITVTCDNITRTVNISLNLSKFNYDVKPITATMFTPISNAIAKQDSAYLKIHLYDLIYSIHNYTYVQNNTYYGRYIYGIYKARCGVLNRYVNLTVGLNTNKTNITIPCDNNTLQYIIYYNKFTNLEGGYKTVAKLYNISKHLINTSTYNIVIDYKKPIIYLVYYPNPNGTVLISMNPEDYISPVTWCNLTLNGQEQFVNRLFETNKVYNFIYALKYGINNIDIVCKDTGPNKRSVSYKINIMPNLLVNIRYKYPELYFVNQLATAYIYVDVYNTGNYNLFKPVTYTIPIAFGYNVSIKDGDTGEILFYKDQVVNSIPLTIDNISAGDSKEYIIKFDFPTVKIMKTYQYFVIEIGKKYNVKELKLQSVAPVVLNDVKYMENIYNCSNFYKAVVDGQEVPFTCSDGYLKLDLGSFAPNQVKDLKIYYYKQTPKPTPGFRVNVKGVLGNVSSFLSSVYDAIVGFIKNLLNVAASISTIIATH